MNKEAIVPVSFAFYYADLVDSYRHCSCLHLDSRNIHGHRRIKDLSSDLSCFDSHTSKLYPGLKIELAISSDTHLDEYQKWFCEGFPDFIKYICNLVPSLKLKYSHICFMNKFRVFENE